MKTLAVGILFAAALLCGPGGARAGYDDLPKITRQTVNGTWEGVTVEEPRLFVLQIEEQRESLGAVVVQVGAPYLSFRMTRIEVSDGRLKAQGTNVDGYRLEIQGKGTAFQGEGLIKATVSLFPPNPKYSATNWTVDLIMRPDGYLAHIAKLRKSAQDGLDALRAGRKAK
jgi:hypothetical protein